MLQYKILLLITIYPFFLPQYATSQITLSEIMFDPYYSESYYEFIEIYNQSSEQSYDLTGWKISDGVDSDEIIDVNNGIVLKPNQFAIIFDPGYFDQDRMYDSLVPSEVLILTIDGSTFGSGGLLNSASETVSLINASGNNISIYRYSIGNDPGYSDEKIDLFADNTTENWSNSLTFNGTPGTPNSVTPKYYDVSIDFDFIPEIPAANTDVTIHVKIKNMGIRSVSNLQIELYEDVNYDSIPSSNEFIFPVEFISENIEVNDSSNFSFQWEKVRSGYHVVIGIITYESDENLNNNILIKSLSVRFIKTDIVISEFMFRPDTANVEWTELFNTTESPIDILNWKLSDSNTNQKNIIISQPYTIPPCGYVIISENENIKQKYPEIGTSVIVPFKWADLNNTGDAIILYDLTNAVIDSIFYHGTWSELYNLSLERRDETWISTDSSTWAPSIDLSGATPGKKNSVAIPDIDLAVTQIYFNNQYPNCGDSIIIYLTIENVGRQKTGNFFIDFYNDFNNDLILEPAEKISEKINYPDTLDRYEQIEFSISWAHILSGMHHIYATVEHQNDFNPDNNRLTAQLNVGYTQKSVVINEIMYSPFENQPEWIELYNRSNSDIYLHNWKISDRDTTTSVKIANISFSIEPNSFIVVTKDTLFQEDYKKLSTNLIICKNFPNLNNDDDDIYLLDINNNIIDFVPYKNSWGGDLGLSLERINTEIVSSDSSNWNSCVNPEGGTPGWKNSIFTRIPPSSATMSISPNPFSPNDDGVDDVTIISYKLPITTAIINIRIYDIRGRLVRFLSNSRATGAEGSVIWNGKNDDDQVCRMGIYIIYLEALNAAKGMVISEKKTVVLAAKL